MKIPQAIKINKVNFRFFMFIFIAISLCGIYFYIFNDPDYEIGMELDRRMSMAVTEKS